MVQLDLTPDDAAVLREILDSQVKQLVHELHHTRDREFKESLKARTARVEALLHRLPAAA